MIDLSGWTAEEIAAYKPRPYGALQAFYKEKKLPASNPAARAQYLAEQVLELTLSHHDVVMRMTNNGGKAAALNYLEDLLIREYNAQGQP